MRLPLEWVVPPPPLLPKHAYPVSWPNLDELPEDEVVEEVTENLSSLLQKYKQIYGSLLLNVGPNVRFPSNRFLEFSCILKQHPSHKNMVKYKAYLEVLSICRYCINLKCSYKLEVIILIFLR